MAYHRTKCVWSTYFDDSSLLRQVVGHRLTGLSGPRALLVMAAHPVAFAGFFAHTGALDDPYARLQRTAKVMDAVAFGSKARAEQADQARARDAPARARRARRRRRAASPPARPTAPTIPRCCCGSWPRWPSRRCSSTSRYVRALERDELNALWRDYRVVGRRFGLRERDMPADIESFEAYMEDMYTGGDLHVTPEARALAVDVVLHPPVPLPARPLVELVNQITVGLLPSGHPSPVRLPLGSIARGRAARRRRVRQTDRRPDRGPRRDWFASTLIAWY